MEQDERHDTPIDARLHAYLDGELTVEETLDFEKLLDDREELRQRLAALVAMQEWLHTSRAAAPADLAESILATLDPASLESRQAAADRAQATGQQTPDRTESAASLWTQLATAARASLSAWADRRVWASPAVALAAILLVIAGLSTRGILQPPVMRPAGLSTGQQTPASVATTGVDGGRDSAGAAGDRGGESGVRYSFELEAPVAQDVCLVGNFNQWKVCSIPLRRSDDGQWTATVELPRGRHEYMFVVDGRWISDPRARLLVDDGFGNQNAILLL